MKFSAILSVLLILLLCITGCDRNDLPDDPWLDVYGTYAGTGESFVPGEFSPPDDSLRNWTRVEIRYYDTISIIPGDCSDLSGGNEGCIRILWERTGRSGGEVREYHMNLINEGGVVSAFKSNRIIHFIPRGEIYPGSGYKLPAIMDSQETGLEFFGGNGLYMYDLVINARADELCCLVLFTGRKISASYGTQGYRGRGYSRQNESKHYQWNIVP